MKSSDLSVEELRENLHYDSDSGNLIWKKSRGHIRAGSVAGYRKVSDSGKTYIKIGFKDKTYFAHRIVWMIVKGVASSLEIDHIDGDGCNNRVENLREVSSELNKKNSKRYKSNTSGVTGVYWLKESKKWMVRVNVDRRIKHIGVFASLEEAIAARKAAERQHGYHENHGSERPL